MKTRLDWPATQSGGLMAAQFESMGKRMQHGFATRNGLYAAHLAAAGYTGIKRVFEREYGGFLSVFGEGHAPDASRITKGLGETWETPRIVVKPYAAMGALHAPLDALFEIAKRCPLHAEKIAHVDVDMSPCRLSSRLVESRAAAGACRRADERRLCAWPSPSSTARR